MTIAEFQAYCEEIAAIERAKRLRQRDHFQRTFQTIHNYATLALWNNVRAIENYERG